MKETSLVVCLLLAVFTAAMGQPSCKLRTFTMADGLPSGTITMCATDPDGMLWIATWNGLCNYDGYRLNSFAAQPGKGQVLTSNRLRSLAPVGNGDIWLRTFDDSLYLFHGKTATYIPYPYNHRTPNSPKTPSNSSETGQKGFHHTDLGGTHWQLLPDGTFGYIDAESGRFVPVMQKMNMQKIVADKRGNLWFTGTHNLSMLSFSNYSFHNKTIVAGSDTRAIEADGNGHVFAGTQSGHLVMLDTEGNTLGFITPGGGLSATETRFCSKGIYALHHDSQGSLWVGTRGEGVFKLSGMHARGFSATRKMVFQPIATDVFDINEDIHHRIWIGTYKQGCLVVTIDGETIASLELPEGNARKVRRIERGQGNTMLLSTADGLFTLPITPQPHNPITLFHTKHKPGDTSSLMARDVLHAICNRTDSALLISTMGGGLQYTTDSRRPTADNLTMTAVKELTEGLGNIQTLTQDDEGRVWVIGENTIRCLGKDYRETAVYGAKDWGEEVEFSEAKTTTDPHSKNIYVATSNGIIVFNPNKIKLSDFAPSLVFCGVQYQGDKRITPLAGCDTLFLPTDRHNAIVYFSALDYGNNDLIRYAWRICELDTAWSYVGQEHCAPLSNLPPGKFTLEVRSTNSDGYWQDNNKTLLIDVEPTFWQSRWAWIIYLAVIAAILYTAFYIIKLRNDAKIEREMAQRKMRLFTDVNTQLRTPLTLIGGPVTEVLQTEQLSEQGRSFLQFVERNASDLISILDKETNTAEPDPFAIQLTEFIEKNIANEQLKIEDIASALCISRSVLYSKVKALYDISPLELVSDIRIKRACQLLAEDNRMNISEIGYATGFSEPKYFTRCFKRRVGQTPSEYRKNAKSPNSTPPQPNNPTTP